MNNLFAVITRERPGRRYTLVTLPNGCPKTFDTKGAQACVEQILRRLDQRALKTHDRKGNILAYESSVDRAPAIAVPWDSIRFHNAFRETYKVGWHFIPKPIRESLAKS